MKAGQTLNLKFIRARRAEWIWIRDRSPKSFFPDPDQLPRITPNRYLYLRRSFHVPSQVSNALAYVSADGRYQLFLNGAFIGRGPVRGSPDYQPADRYDLTPFLHKGLNSYAVLVHAYGRHTSWYELPRPFLRRHFGSGGFFLQSDIRTEEGPLTVDTDGSWKCMEATAWQRDVPGGSRGFVEIYDASEEPLGWREPAYDDASWHQVEVLRRPGENDSPDIVPFPVMIERMIPFLDEKVMPGSRLLQYEEVLLQDEDSPLPDLFDNMTATVKRKCRIADPESCLTEGEKTDIATVKGRGILLVIDFGRVVVGRPRFSVSSEKDGALIDFTCGEYLDASGRVVVNAGIPGINVPQIHRYRARAGDQNFERFHWEGFRYLELLIHRADTPLEISGVGAMLSSYPATRQGYFNSSDALLNKIWRVGINTLEACRQDSFMDCPTREQRQWMGDGYVEMMVNWAAFGDPLLAGQMLYHIAWSQKPDGLTAMAAPGDFSREDLLHIPDYALYWILGLERYHLYTGNKEIVADLFPVAERLVAWFERFIDDNGLVTGLPGWTFIDWAEVDKKGASTAVNAQYAGALRAMARMAPLSGCGEKSDFFNGLARRTREAINRLLWDASRGVYIDGLKNAAPSRRVSQQSNAAVIAFEVAPADRRPLILDYILREDRWVVTRSVSGPPAALDEAHQVVRTQPFYAHHLHRAMYLDGRFEAMVHHIRRYWGALAEAGDTFPELWHQTPASTTCHAWSATPTFDLSSYILGVLPLEPGFKKFLVMPNPVHLAYCQGLFPSVSGDISVEWFYKNKHFHLTFQVPDACEADLMLPPWVTQDAVVEYNGRNLIAGEGHRIFRTFKTGSHSFVVKNVPPPDLQAAPPPVMFPPPEVSIPEIQVPGAAEIVRMFTSRYVEAQGDDEALAVGLLISGRAWTLTIRDGKLRVRKGFHMPPLVLSTSSRTLYAILTGRVEGSDAVASGRLRFRGDLSLLPRFLERFGF